MLQIDSIRVGSMPNGAHYAYHNDRVYPKANADANVKAIAAEQLTAYHAAIQAEDDALKLSQKSLITDDIMEADKQRDALYGKFKQSVKSYLSFPDNEIALAAKVINQSLKDYAIDPAMQMDKETGMLSNLIQDLQGKLAAQVTTLNLGLFVTQMKKYNDLVITLVASRTEERTSKIVGATKAARQQVDEAYRQLILVVNAYIIVQGESKYKAFAEYMNALIREYKVNVLGQKPSTTGGNVTPGGGDDVPDSESPGEI